MNKLAVIATGAAVLALAGIGIAVNAAALSAVPDSDIGQAPQLILPTSTPDASPAPPPGTDPAPTPTSGGDDHGGSSGSDSGSGSDSSGSGSGDDSGGDDHGSGGHGSDD